ncbi:type VI secretion system baseplate subunit TssF [Enterobacter hormaechei]|uniref:type VI secretion system baseplate subunit TssF n=1 Tax=Enterobacter hormaechei TaxID=158836 RepID=UPI00030FF20A|nr:type VI secretion system baseplate subunit TssF [Enterobacter hormaechei]MBG0573195.1 type VI secretion system baseplate subunit TssF [Enterobacter hormaechei]
MRIARGFEVNSRPIGEKGTRCRYTTTKEITLQPLALEHARLSTDPDGRSVISLRFSCSHLADWSRVDLSQIPFYFNADAPLACAMHEAFTMNTVRLWLRMPGDMDRRPMDGYFTALGFGDDDRLWPKGDSSFSGYQLLLEYFTFREKFMFIPGTADHIATPVSRFLALLGVLQQPGKTQEGMQALVTLLAPDTTVKVSPYCLRPVEMGQPLGFYGDDDFLLDGNTPLGDEAMDAGSQLLVALTTDNEQEAQGWKPDGLLYQDFLVMLRVWLGWRFKAKITLTTRTRLLAVPPLGEGPFWLGMNGVLGADEGELKDDIPPTFTTELGYYTGLKPAIPQQGNRRVTYKFD